MSLVPKIMVAKRYYYSAVAVLHIYIYTGADPPSLMPNTS